MDAARWLAYVAVAGALLVLPGPDWAFMIAAGVRQSRITSAVAGLTTGYVILSFVVAAGIGPLIMTLPSALVVVTVGGAAYLVFLGVRNLRTPRVSSPSSDSSSAESAPMTGTAEQMSAWPMVRQGTIVSALNAKSLVLFVALLPQFVTPSAPLPLWAQLAVLGLTWAGMGAIFNTLLGTSSRKLLGGRPTVAHAMTRVTGAAMITMGLFLAGEQIISLTASTA